jgi:hypothetical protein
MEWKRIRGFDTMAASCAALVLALLVPACALNLEGKVTQDAETPEQGDPDGSEEVRFDTPDDGAPDRDAVDDGGEGACVPLGAESCNGLDDDCNGLIDEDLGDTTCGDGDCTRTVPNCLDGVEQECVPGEPDEGTCDAPEPGCGQTTEGHDNCLNPCTREGPAYCTCTGGIESDVTVEGVNYRVHAFTDVGDLTLECVGTVTLEYLVIAGGGGGGSGRAGGGGGAGGYLAGAIDVSGSVPVTVGGGGAVENPGGNSVLSTVTAVGGGGGGHGESPEAAGQAGGSGGGGGFKNIGGGAGTPGQGNDGGAARSGNWIAGGGGGGAGGVGTPGTGDNEGVGGNGGPGLDSDITGTTVTRAGGGAGNGEHHDGTAGSGGGGAVGVSGGGGGRARDRRLGRGHREVQDRLRNAVQLFS